MSSSPFLDRAIHALSQGFVKPPRHNLARIIFNCALFQQPVDLGDGFNVRLGFVPMMGPDQRLPVSQLMTAT
jgi:hypothetical protein